MISICAFTAIYYLAASAMILNGNQSRRSLSAHNLTHIPTPSRRDFNPTPPKRNLETPAPTGKPTLDYTIFIEPSTRQFALLLPETPGETIADSENDAVAYCTSDCSRPFPEGFIKNAAIVEHQPHYIQVTGCFDPSRFHFSKNDEGGQLDVRFPNGAFCKFGGYGASFIEQIEPQQGRFCLRCCATENDQENCNSHSDTAGCPAVIPGKYDGCD